MYPNHSLRRSLAGLAMALLATTATAKEVQAGNERTARTQTAGARLAADESDAVRRGRYIARTAGCNDCHTAGYPEAAGMIPEAEWLTGSNVGFRGPWGTSYAANLRLSAQRMNEAQWMARARSPMLPPMPWFSLRDMSEADVRALYAYLRALGPRGEPAPDYVNPGAPVRTPFIEFVPQNLPPQASAR